MDNFLEKTKFEISDIIKILPHRYPFILIDKIEIVKPGESLIALKNVTINEPFFQGHFPNKPVMPGVLILEAMAQASGILGFMTMEKTPDDGSIYYFAGVDKVRFKRPVNPGDIVDFNASIISEKRGIWKFDCRAEVGGELVCEAVVLCADRSI